MRPFSFTSPILLILFLISFHGVMAQEEPEPYTARAYWLEEQNQVYQRILVKKENDESLSPAEEQYVADYREYLKTYFSRLSQEEKERYFEFKSQWDDEKAEASDKEVVREDVTELSRAGARPGRKFLFTNGLYGIGYGLVVDYIFEIEPPLSVAVPILTAGTSLLLPLSNTKRYEGINFGTVLLARHGKFIGALHGAALGLVITGNPDESGSDAAGKIIAGSAMLGSIALGEVGFQLGKKNNWSEGRISTYRYYSLIGPGLSFAGLIAGNVNDARIYGGANLIAGGLSYLYADRVFEKYHFSRGDILAGSSFALLSTGFGFGLVNITKRWHMLVPAATLVGGTLANHAMLRNAQFTSREGWNVNYVTGAVSVLGLGIAVLINADTHYPYFLVPSTLGMLSWVAMTSRTKKKLQSGRSNREGQKWARASLSLTPHHYFLNKEMKTTGNPGQQTALPMFSFHLSF